MKKLNYSIQVVANNYGNVKAKANFIFCGIPHKFHCIMWNLSDNL